VSEGVTVTASWTIKPECAEVFVETLRQMFPVTRTHIGFRNIRLLRSESDPNQFILIQDWDAAQNHRDYAQFRVERGDTAKLLEMVAGVPQMGYWDIEPLASAQALGPASTRPAASVRR